MNQIDAIFQEKRKNILSIYFTAGFPGLNDTADILNALQSSGVDMIEVGIPFSDPLADGPTIQHSSEVALENGMTLKLLFEQLSAVDCRLPTLLMGYLNPVLQFGIEKFCKKASELGISGVIIPDLPMREYLDEYKRIFDKYDLRNIFLITPQTSEERIRMIDKHTNGFIYAVSSASTTGTKMGMDAEKEKFFKRLGKMKLNNPVMIGFGISDKQTFDAACGYANGAIIGSAFIKAIGSGGDLSAAVSSFVGSIRK